tara:strand:+ start:428 stop:607 length:180 start_codon:yes stop_codon:yes gene_type:complete
MKLRQQQITKIEEKLEQIEQQDYVTYNGRNWVPFSEVDLPSLKAMLNDLREEIENEQKI